MKYVLIGTEGNASEPGNIDGVVLSLRRQSPMSYANLEIIPLPLGGNHGHGAALIKKFQEEIDKYLIDPNHCVEPHDEVIRILVCDYDEMDKRGIDVNELRTDVENMGASLIITKPRFEYFVARLFWEESILLDKIQEGKGLKELIQDGINLYNAECLYDFQKIPPYSKGIHRSEIWFGHLFNVDPSFLTKASQMEINTNPDYYTEMPILIRQLKGYFDS